MRLIPSLTRLLRPQRLSRGLPWRGSAALLTAVVAVWACASALTQTPTQPRQTSPYGRPQPTRPVRPVIPEQNRNQPGKVFLEHADSLFTNPDFGHEERQILRGNVQFRQGAMVMDCDSAYYYPERNSMDAFGNVRMTQHTPQGTRRGFADVLFYDGDSKLARLRTRGHQKVRLEDTQATLVSDSIDYSMIPGQERGWYDHGGRLDCRTRDGEITITSWRGNYTPGTSLAEFEEDVVLVNRKEGYTLRTQQLLFNTQTKIASIQTYTEIEGRSGNIVTTHGQYNTDSGEALLDSRSTIEHIDTAGNAVTLEGDSIIYERESGVSRAYAFRDPTKPSQPVVVTDTAHRAILTGGYAYYDNNRRVSVAADYPLLREYSRADTLQLRADTIRTHVLTRMVLPPARRDSLLAIFRDSVAAAGALPDSLRPRTSPAAGPVELGPDGSAAPGDGLLMGALLAPRLTAEQQYLARADSALLVPDEYYFAQAYHRARFFRPDVQGVADSLSFNQSDSLLHMSRRPVVWSGDRQVAGNHITVHFNDSTADWALLPDYGIMSEHVADEFYNQMSGRRLLALFSGGELRRLEADGNVQTIFLPAERDTLGGKSDTTYNKLVEARGGYLTIDMSPGRRLGRLKMWPEVSGSVTPIFLVRRQQLYLPGFEVLEEVRPRRSWFPDGTVRWADELGDVPEALDLYLSLPPLTGTGGGAALSPP